MNIVPACGHSFYGLRVKFQSIYVTWILIGILQLDHVLHYSLINRPNHSGDMQVN